MASVRSLAFVAVALALPACAASADRDRVTGETASDLDTSGCSGLDRTLASGPVTVHAGRPPSASCWNISESGLRVEYAWLQTNAATPRNDDIGFWTELNGAGTYAKATSYACEEVSGGGLGADTSGDRTYRCTATRTLTFGEQPSLLRAAYGADGTRLAWDVRVGVSLDDHGTWDSLGGANYRFSF
jgi:hypothetical protein